MGKDALSPVFGLDAVLKDAVALHQRNAEMTRRREKLRQQRRAQQKAEQYARDCLFAAERAARVFVRDVADVAAPAACAEALVKAGQAMSATRGLATLETFLAPETLPPSDTSLGVHLLPLRLLIELLRLGQQGKLESIIAQLQRLSDIPALQGFIDWFDVAADFLCGVGEQEPGIRILASLPMPTHNCSPATRDALLRVLYGFAYPGSAVVEVESGGKAVAQREAELPEAGTDQSHFSDSQVGADTSSMPEADNIVLAVIEDVGGTETAKSDAEKATGGKAAGSEFCKYVFRKRGDYWFLRFGEEMGLIKHSSGMRHLARLLARPDRPLSGADFNPLRQEQGAVPELVSDAMTYHQCRQRFEELQAELERARRDNCSAEDAEIRQEMRQLAEALDPHRRRLGNSPQHKSWRAAKTAIRRALRAIGRILPKLSAYLDRTIQLKSEPAVYSPQSDLQTGPIRWEI
jgi:hypothetical protein